MILSKANSFIFIKGVKVGGTSVEIALSTLCGPEDILCPITPIDELRRLEMDAGARNYSADRTAELEYLDTLRRTAISDLAKFPIPTAAYFNHMSLRDVLRLQGPDVLQYRVLCVERNPYAKIISWANHMLSFDSYQIGRDMQSDWSAMRSYLDRAVADGSIIAVKNIDRYRRPDGSTLAHVMRFENLDSAFEQYVRSLGIKSCPRLPHAKKGISANDLDPRDLLNQQQINTINQIFCEEFETFGYEPLE